MNLNSLFINIPGVLSFIIILFLGSLLSMMFSVIAQIFFAALNLKYPSFWGKIVGWSTFGIAVVFSFEQLGIAGKLLSIILILITSILGLSIVLAFGLGCKDIAREFIIEIIKKNKTDSPDE